MAGHILADRKPSVAGDRLKAGGDDNAVGQTMLLNKWFTAGQMGTIFLPHVGPNCARDVSLLREFLQNLAPRHPPFGAVRRKAINFGVAAVEKNDAIFGIVQANALRE